MKNSQNYNFKHTNFRRIPRTWKNKQHENIYTMKISEVKPIFWQFLTPDDKFKDQVFSYSRLAPMQSPMFSRLDLKTRMFCVPLRKLQPDFEDFVSSLPSDNRKMIHATIENLMYAVYDGIHTQHVFSDRGTLEDFIGVPPIIDNLFNFLQHEADATWTYQPIPVTRTLSHFLGGYMNALRDDEDGLTQWLQSDANPEYKDLSPDVVFDYVNAQKDEPINLLPFLAYHKVFDDWFIDRRFQPDYSAQLFEQIDSVNTYPEIKYTDQFTITFNDGSTTTRGILRFLLSPRNANYGKDYFTTCGDGAQAGPALSLIGQRLDIYGSISNQYLGDSYQTVIGSPDLGTAGMVNKPRQRQYNTAHYVDTNNNYIPTSADFKIGDVWAEVNEADLLTPTKIRYQQALQQFLERMNSGGYNRYTDFVFGEYGIRIPDQFLQRSVLVGACSTPVHVDEVVTSADGEADDISSHVGDYVGRGQYKGGSKRIFGHVKEHCIYLSIQYVVPQQYYWQGLRKDLSRLDNLAFPHPLFQHLGEELVYNKEIYFGERINEPFGYNYRYAFEQTALDEIHGDIRGDLFYWRTGRNMVETPSLSAEFIQCKPNDCNRIFAYEDSRSNPFIVYSQIRFAHKMPLSNVIGNGRIG